MYQKLSAKVDKVSYNAAKNMTMALYPTCKNEDAWDPVNVEMYNKCTDEISRSSSVIQESIGNIELYSANRNGEMLVQTELEQILEDIKLDPNTAKGLEFAIAHIEKESATSNQSLTCIEIDGCLVVKREVVIRLKMIEWGIYGLGTASAGSFLAYHHLMLGPYFGDVDGNEWPYIPLHNQPTSLEDDFNQLLMNLTSEMSNESLKNISLLDLPAFGSMIGTLRKDLKKQFVWPIKTNFALYKTIPEVDKKRISVSYKTLTDDWAYYMHQLDKKDYVKYFTLEMKNNKYFNFTKFIQADMKTFLTAIAGNTEVFFKIVFIRSEVNPDCIFLTLKHM